MFQNGLSGSKFTGKLLYGALMQHLKQSVSDFAEFAVDGAWLIFGAVFEAQSATCQVMHAINGPHHFEKGNGRGIAFDVETSVRSFDG